MANDIQLGYLIQESDSPSTPACSLSLHSADTQEQRTMDWITNVPENHETASNGDGVNDLKDKKGKLQEWRTPASDILRGSPAKFVVHRDRWMPVRPKALRNDLLFSVGFLELANACDFPANIWNQTPVPLFAAILMGVGGSIALLLMYCAVQDMRMSLANLQLLSAERRRLKVQLQQTTNEEGVADQKRSIQACIAVNTREYGFELVDRFLMDTIMGFGCLLVGVGTLMAIGGINSRVYVASNLLTGYIGNAPAAMYGLLNAIWSTYIWFKADTHSRLSCNDIAVALIWPQLSQRHDTIKLHAVVYGLTSLVAGAGALMTATLWYGYVMLIPCVLASAWCNWLWKNKCGYGRPVIEAAPLLDRDCLIAEIQAIALLRRNLERIGTESLIQNEGLASVLEILQRYDLMTAFCTRLRNSDKLALLLFDGSSSTEKTIENDDFLRLNPSTKEEIIQSLNSFLSDSGDKKLVLQALVYRERCLLELLGSWYFYQQSINH